MRPLNFRDAVSADLTQLHSYLDLEFRTQDVLAAYMLCRRDYLAGDLLSLRKRLIQWHATAEFPSWLLSLVELRLCVRQKEAHMNEAAVVSELRGIGDSPWAAEIEMVLGMYYEEQKRFQESAEAYLASASLFLNQGLVEKSLSAEFNALIVKTHTDPERRYLVSYNAFVVRALAANYTSLAAVALANFAREYQILGLHELALQKTEEALQLMKKTDYGTLHYYMTLAQALDLLVTLKKFERAGVLHEELKSSPYVEVEEILKVLERYVSCDFSETPSASLPISWAERLRGREVGVDTEAMTELEMQLIDQLTTGPATLVALAVHLYGDKIDLESAVARAKQAVYRLRKKIPNLIVLRKGQYELVD